MSSTPCPTSHVSTSARVSPSFPSERKGKILHLLKASSKPVSFGRKRKRFEVFDPVRDAQQAHLPPPQPNVKQEVGQQPSEALIDTTAKVDKSTLRKRQPEHGGEEKR